MSDEKTPALSAAEKIAAAKAEKDRLDQLERTTGASGAVPLEPKQSLLRMPADVKVDPAKHYRWVNVGNHEKAQLRQAQGYERVPVAEGGRQVGNLALFAVPRQVYEQRVAAQKKMNNDRLKAHQTEVEKIADGVAKELRDRHGIKVDPSRIFINEG